MIADIFNKEEISFFNSRHVAALNNIAKLYKGVPKYEKYQYINALRSAKLTLPEVRSLGFNCSNNLWKSSLNKEPRGPVGRKCLKTEIRSSMNNYLDKNSEIAANRTVLIKNPDDLESDKQIVSVKYRHTNLTDLYTNFDRKEELSYSSFYKYVPKEIKKPHRFDLLFLILFN